MGSVVFPRLSDVEQDMVELAQAAPNGEFCLTSLDISYAFHLIPLRKAEGDFTMARLGNHVYVFLSSSLEASQHPQCGEGSRP